MIIIKLLLNWIILIILLLFDLIPTDKKTELRLKKIEANQRYFEKIQNVQHDTIDIHNIKLSRITKLLKIH